MTGRSPQDTAAFKANLLEMAVIIPALAAGLVAAIATARVTAGSAPVMQLVWIAAAALPAHYGTRTVLHLIVRDAQRRLHVAAGCVDCISHR